MDVALTTLEAHIIMITKRQLYLTIADPSRVDAPLVASVSLKSAYMHQSQTRVGKRQCNENEYGSLGMQDRMNTVSSTKRSKRPVACYGLNMPT